MYPLLLALAAATAFAAAPRFTLEQVMSKPFASELTPGPGGRVAWTVNLLGARNIWIAEAPDYRGRALTSFTGDDGQDIGELHWMPDGMAVVFVRGGDLEHPHREFPNPLSRPEGVEQGVWLGKLDGPVRKLADGGSAAPLGANRVLFTKDGEIWSVGIAAADKPVLVAKPRGGAQSLTPSPDGSAVAFTSSRQDHTFIGVYHFADKSLRYLDASVDTDLSPVWSSDSKSLAFIRIAAQSQRLGGPVRTSADPWSIRIADAATGRGREVWKAQTGRG